MVITGNIAPPRFRDEDRDRNRCASPERLIYVGGLGERKGVRYLVEAVRLLRERDIDVSLTVVGGGSMIEEIAEFASGHRLEEAYRLVGRQGDPFGWIADAGLLVVPSLFDSYPDVVLEALHVGTPVIGSRVGGIPDILCHDLLLFPPGDASAIADRIASFVADADLYREAARLCRERRDEFRFDWAGEFERHMRQPAVSSAERE